MLEPRHQTFIRIRKQPKILLAEVSNLRDGAIEGQYEQLSQLKQAESFKKAKRKNKYHVLLIHKLF